MEILIALLLLLSFSILLGKLFERVGITEIVGQILAGIILGPSIFGFVTPSTVLSGIAEVAIFFILLFIGIQITTEVLTDHLRSASYFTLSSFIIPSFVMAFLGIYIFNITPSAAITASIALGVPSISIVSVLVYRHSIINQEDGLRLLAGVISADIVAFVIFAVILHKLNPLITVAALAVFLALLLLIDYETKRHSKGLRKIFSNLIKKRAEETLFALVILMGLIVSAIFQVIGITYVLGALFAGMLIHKTTVGVRPSRMLSNTFRRLNDSFFIPIFFSIAGLAFTFPSAEYDGLLISMVLVAMCVGGTLNYIAANNRFTKLQSKDAVGILGSRGAVGIIIASLALQYGIISNQLYTVVLVGTITLSIIMPLALTKKSERRAIEE